jgi:hypothetical protein
MEPILRHFIETQRANGYAGFKGAVIYGTIPMRQEVINEILRETVLKSNDLVKQIQLTVEDQNHINVNLTLRKWVLTKNFDIKVYIDPIIDFPNSPKIRIWLARSHWFLGRITQLLTSLFGPLAAGVQVRGKLIEVDLKAMLWRTSLSEVVRLIKSAEIRGERGQLLLKFRLVVE